MSERAKADRLSECPQRISRRLPRSVAHTSAASASPWSVSVPSLPTLYSLLICLMRLRMMVVLPLPKKPDRTVTAETHRAQGQWRDGNQMRPAQQATANQQRTRPASQSMRPAVCPEQCSAVQLVAQRCC